MIWYFNYCMPFDQQYEFNRKLMVMPLVLLLFIYIYMRINLQYMRVKEVHQDKIQLQTTNSSSSDQNSKDKMEKSGKIEQKEQQEKQARQTANQTLHHSHSKIVEYQFKKNSWNDFMRSIMKAIYCYDNLSITLQEFDTHAPVIVGQHMVCVLFTVQYSPFIPQIALCWLFPLVIILLLIARQQEYTRTMYFVYGVKAIINLVLLHSGFYMLAQFGWDDINVNCFKYEN